MATQVASHRRRERRLIVVGVRGEIRTAMPPQPDTAPDCPECSGTGEYAVCPAGHSNPPYCGCIESYRACAYCEGTGHARCGCCGVRPGERWQAEEVGDAPVFVCVACTVEVAHA
jgi:hypothetical protein